MTELSPLLLLVALFATVCYAYEHFRKHSRPCRDHSCVFPVALLSLVAIRLLLPIIVWFSWSFTSPYELGRSKSCRKAFYAVQACAGSYYAHQGGRREDDNIRGQSFLSFIVLLGICLFIYFCRLSAALPVDRLVSKAVEHPESHAASSYGNSVVPKASACHPSACASCHASTSPATAIAQYAFLPRLDRMENMINHIFTMSNGGTQHGNFSATSSFGMQGNDSDGEIASLRKQLFDITEQLRVLAGAQHRLNQQVTGIREDLDLRDFDHRERVDQLQRNLERQQRENDDVNHRRSRLILPLRPRRRRPLPSPASTEDMEASMMELPAMTEDPLPAQPVHDLQSSMPSTPSTANPADESDSDDAIPTASPAAESDSDDAIPSAQSSAPPDTRPASTEQTPTDEPITAPHVEDQDSGGQNEALSKQLAPTKALVVSDKPVGIANSITVADEEKEASPMISAPFKPFTPSDDPLSSDVLITAAAEEIRPLETEEESLPNLLVSTTGPITTRLSSPVQSPISGTPAMERDLPKESNASSESPVLTQSAAESSLSAENQHEIPSSLSEIPHENGRINIMGEAVVESQTQAYQPIEPGPPSWLELSLPTQVDIPPVQEELHQSWGIPAFLPASNVDMQKNALAGGQPEDATMSDIAPDDLYDHEADAEVTVVDNVPCFQGEEMDVDNAPHHDSSQADPMDISCDAPALQPLLAFQLAINFPPIQPSVAPPSSQSTLYMPPMQSNGSPLADQSTSAAHQPTPIRTETVDVLVTRMEAMNLRLDTVNALSMTPATQDTDMQDAPQTPDTDELAAEISRLAEQGLWAVNAPQLPNSSADFAHPRDIEWNAPERLAPPESSPDSGKRAVAELSSQSDAIEPVRLPDLSLLTTERSESAATSTTENQEPVGENAFEVDPAMQVSEGPRSAPETVVASEPAPEQQTEARHSTSSDACFLEEDKSLLPAPDYDPLGFYDDDDHDHDGKSGLAFKFQCLEAWVAKIDHYRQEWERILDTSYFDPVAELVLCKLAEWAEYYYEQNDRAHFDILRLCQRPDAFANHGDKDSGKVKMIGLEKMLKRLYECMTEFDANLTEGEKNICFLASKVITSFGRTKYFKQRFGRYLPKYNSEIRRRLANSYDEEGGLLPYSVDEEVSAIITHVGKMMEMEPQEFAEAVHDDSSVASFAQMLEDLARATDGQHGHGVRNKENAFVHLIVKKLLKCLKEYPIQHPAADSKNSASSSSSNELPANGSSDNLNTTSAAQGSHQPADSATSPRSPEQSAAGGECGNGSELLPISTATGMDVVVSAEADTPQSDVETAGSFAPATGSGVDSFPPAMKGSDARSEGAATMNMAQIEVLYGEADAALGDMDRRAAGSYFVPAIRLDQLRGVRHVATGAELTALSLKKDPLPKNSPKSQPRRRKQPPGAPVAVLRDRSEMTKASIQTQMTFLTYFLKVLSARPEWSEIGSGLEKSVDNSRAAEATKRLINIFKIWDQSPANMKRILRNDAEVFAKVHQIGIVIQDTPEESNDFNMLKEEIRNVSLRVKACLDELRDEDLRAEEARIRADPDEVDMGPISHSVPDPAGNRYVDTESDRQRLEYLSATCAILTRLHSRAEELGYLPFDSAEDKGLVLSCRKELKEVWLNFRESGNWVAMAKPGGIIRFYMETEIVELCKWVQERAVGQLKSDNRCRVDAKTVEDLREAAVGILAQHVRAQTG